LNSRTFVILLPFGSTMDNSLVL